MPVIVANLNPRFVALLGPEEQEDPRAVEREDLALLTALFYMLEARLQ
jgi:hypothetical protein